MNLAIALPAPALQTAYANPKTRLENLQAIKAKIPQNAFQAAGKLSLRHTFQCLKVTNRFVQEFISSGFRA